MLLLAGITTGHKIGLGVVALVFIVFALTASLVVPRRRPGFPGRNGLSVFVIAAIFLFAAMLTAVAVFGKEKEASGAGETTSAVVVNVKEVEYKITLSPRTVKHGTITFVVANAGKIPHNLTIQGGKHTANIAPGQSAKLTVTLKKGVYTLYCSIPGHRQLGMVTELTAT